MDLSGSERISSKSGCKQHSSLETHDTLIDVIEGQVKVSSGLSSNLPPFTFVPEVHTLQIKSIVTEGEIKPLTSKMDKEKVTVRNMTEAGVFKAEVVFIRDSEDRGAENKAKDKTCIQSKAPADHMTPPQTSIPVNVQAKSPAFHFVEAPSSMETAVDKHQDSSQQRCHTISEAAEVTSGLGLNRPPESDDRLSPTNSTDLFPTLTSSRESMLSDGWDRERSWSGMLRSMEASPVSFSRTMSPCSTVCSPCMFSPAVVRVTRHSLAPGSSLVHMPPTCSSSSQDGMSSSSGILSPTSRHRPPPSRLSLLTAILRKGRLPVLSASVQRPYSPCWPINAVSLSSCNACSAASSLASIPLQVSSRDCSSSISGAPPAQIRSLKTGCALGCLACVATPPAFHLRERSGPYVPSLRQSERQESNNGPGRETNCHTPESCRSLSQILPSGMKNNSGLKAVPWPLYSSDYELPSHCKPVENVATREPRIISPYLFSSTSGLHSQTTKVKPIKGKQIPYKACADCSLHFSCENCDSLNPIVKHADLESPVSSPQPTSSLSRFSSLSSELSTQSCLAFDGEPSPVYSPGSTVSISRPSTVEIVSSPAQNGAKDVSRIEKGLQSTTDDRSTVRAHCLSPSRYTPITFRGGPSPRHSPSSTPDHFTLCPSPATQPCDLTSSSSLSIRSTPSPRPGSGMSDNFDRSCKIRQPHKIKLSYKTLAAIPTNTLLLDQQTIDDPVGSSVDPDNKLDRHVEKDTHAEMCSPAQLRQQSEELYAVIDEVLEASNPIRQPSPANRSSRSLIDKIESQQYTSIPRSIGRETKYAAYSVQPPVSFERKLLDPYQTKPGVIRPVTVSPRLTMEDNDDTNHSNPFRQYLEDPVSDNRKSTHPIVTIHENEALMSNKTDNLCQGKTEADSNISTGGKTFKKDKNTTTGQKGPLSTSTLVIMESEGHNSQTAKQGSWREASSPFNTSKVKIGVHETHI